MGQGTGSSQRLLYLPGLPSLPLVFFLRIFLLCISTILLISLVASGRMGQEKAADLSAYPWVYLRDDEPLGPGENLVEVIAVGDVMVGRDVPDRPFADVEWWLREADLVLGNLECVIGGDPALELVDTEGSAAEYVLHAPPSVAGTLHAAGFSVLGLANNHALDLGARGLERSASLLEAVGISALGVGPDEDAALKPVLREVKGVRLAMLAFNAVPGSRPTGRDTGWIPAVWDRDRAIAAVSAATGRAHVVLVSIHWGYEYQRVVDPAQPDAAQALLEAGADLIVGHHPHVVQPLEIHQRQVVAYSLGNFVFDQQQGETGRGLALRVLFSDEGLRAVQALPLWTGPRPRLMMPEEAVLFLTRVAPAQPRLHFACDELTCRQLDVPPGSHVEIGSALFWGGEIDLTGDGRLEQVRREGERVIIYEDGVEMWRSPSGWRVVDVALGDVTDDGRNELVLALWKEGLDGLEPPDPAKESMLRSRPFIVGYRGGTYRTLWGGSAVSLPIHEIQLADVDGDATKELIVLEGDDGEERTVSVWSWHGWGFTLRWRSSPGPYGELTVDEDGIFSVTAE